MSSLHGYVGSQLFCFSNPAYLQTLWVILHPNQGFASIQGDCLCIQDCNKRTLLFPLERYQQTWLQELRDPLLKIKTKVEAAKEKA
jgi:hypothetical protein